MANSVLLEWSPYKRVTVGDSNFKVQMGFSSRCILSPYKDWIHLVNTAIFYKVNNLRDFLSALLHYKPLLKLEEDLLSDGKWVCS